MKTSTIVDTNILIDAWGPPSRTTEWSNSALTECHGSGDLVVNSIIWSELAPLIADEAALEGAAAKLKLVREFLPWKAAFLAGLAGVFLRVLVVLAAVVSALCRIS